MSIKIPQLASLLHLEALRINLLQGCKLHAYQNDFTPINTTIITDMTEATFSGYSVLTLGTWGVSFLNSDLKAESDHPLVTWTLTSVAITNTLYGIYVTDPSNNLLYAERNPGGGVLLNSIGATYSYVPRFTYKSEF